MPGTITVSACRSSSSPWSGSTWKPAVLRTGRPPGVHARDRVERRPVGGRGPRRRPARGAEVEADHARRGRARRSGAGSSAHGPILAHDGFPATRRRPRAPPRLVDVTTNRRLHPAWLVAAVAFVALVGAAGLPRHPVGAAPPAARGVRLAARHHLRGRLGQPAALRADRAVRRRADGPVRHPPGGAPVALLLVAAGSGLTVFMTASWQLIALLGRAGRAGHRLDGAGLRGDRHRPLVRPAPGPGHRRAHRRRGGRATGLPAAARRAGAATTAGARRRSSWPAAALAVVPLVVWLLRDHPADLGLPAYGATEVVAARRRRPAARPRRALSARWPPRPGPGRSGCWPAASRSAARPPTAWSAPTSSRPRTTTAWPRPPPPACSPWSGSSTSSARSPPAGSPTGSTAGCCSASTTRCAGCRCWCCRACSPAPPSRACWCSSSSTAWTGWPPCRRRWRCAGSTSARAGAVVFGWVFAAAPVRRGVRRDRRRRSSGTGSATTRWPGTWPARCRSARPGCRCCCAGGRAGRCRRPVLVAATAPRAWSYRG